MIYAVSEIGEMVDFLKAFPGVVSGVEEYKWGLPCTMIELMRADNTHLEHLGKKEVERRKRMKGGVNIGGEYGFDGLNDLGGRVFGDDGK